MLGELLEKLRRSKRRESGVEPPQSKGPTRSLRQDNLGLGGLAGGGEFGKSNEVAGRILYADFA